MIAGAAMNLSSVSVIGNALRLRMVALRSVAVVPAPPGHDPSETGRSRRELVGSRPARSNRSLCLPGWKPTGRGSSRSPFQSPFRRPCRDRRSSCCP